MKIKKIKTKSKKNAEKRSEKEELDLRREEVLARGRKFKYPLQYAQHKLVLNTIIVAFVGVLLVGVMGFVALYKMRDASDIAYKVTKVLPLPVAEVEGEKVLFSDYLMIYRSSVIPAEQQQGRVEKKSDMEAIKEHYKKEALNDAEEYAYAMKLGRELGVKVEAGEVEGMYNQHKQISGAGRSEESFLRILRDNFGLSKEEFKRILGLSLVKAKVSKEIDSQARELVKKAEGLVREGQKDFGEIAKALGKEVGVESTGGIVEKTNVDGGRTMKAMKLEVGGISEGFISSNGDNYYLVKVVEKNDVGVSYESLQIPLREFGRRMENLRKEGKVKEYIEVKSDEAKTD